jgi:predicted transposase YdaD
MSSKPHMWRDLAWKEVLSDGAKSAIEYLLPDLAADMDPTKELTGIPGMELFSDASDSDKYMRVLDVYFDVPMLNEENGNVALFIEQQHEGDKSFGRRVFDTYVRLREKRRVRTTGAAIYTGDSPDVNTYTESCYGFEVSVKFRTYHLPSKDLDALRDDTRPFARVMLAGRLSFDAGDDTELREKYAWELLNTTNEQDYDREKKLFILEFSRRIFRVNDPQMSHKLKEVYEMQTIPLREYSQQVKSMLDREEGRVEGKVEGRVEGREEGRVEGKIEVARNFLKMGLPIEQVAHGTGLSVEDINSLR